MQLRPYMIMYINMYKYAISVDGIKNWHTCIYFGEDVQISGFHITDLSMSAVYRTPCFN